jgi:hypothetical protein
LKTIGEEARGAEEGARTMVEFVCAAREMVVVELRTPSPFVFPFARAPLIIVFPIAASWPFYLSHMSKSRSKDPTDPAA